MILTRLLKVQLKLISLFILVFFIIGNARGDQTAGQDIPEKIKGPVIYAIEVLGNNITSEELILREMRLKPGMTASPKQIEKDRLRLSSLGLFNRVEMRMASSEGRAILQVVVTEPYYIFPELILSWDPENPGKKVYGMGLYHFNVRGNGEKVGGAGWTGFSEGFFLIHDDPWFSIDGKYGINARVYFSSRELLDSLGNNAGRETQGFAVMLVRRLKRNSWIGLSGDWEARTSGIDDFTITPGIRDRLITFGITFLTDHRDYYIYPSKGFYLTGSVESTRITDTKIYYTRETLDFRAYKTIRCLTLAGRLWTKLGQNEPAPYHYMYIDRGYVRAGSAFSNPEGVMTGTNLEIRFCLLDIPYISFSGIPVAGQYLRNLKFIIDGVVFVDAGFSSSPEFESRDEFSAFGLGLQFQVPYIRVLHLLWGWTEYQKWNQPSITLGLGVTF